MIKHPTFIVVIGASAGGLDTLVEMVSGFQKGLDVAYCIAFIEERHWRLCCTPPYPGHGVLTKILLNATVIILAMPTPKKIW